MLVRDRLFIGGQWVAAKNKATFPVYNPSTGEVWSQVADADRSDDSSASSTSGPVRTSTVSGTGSSVGAVIGASSAAGGPRAARRTSGARR